MKIQRVISIIAISLWLVFSLYGLIFNISYIDEAKYLIKGFLLVSGKVSYYKTPEFFYQHMPGGLLWFGLGQKLFGPNLLVGRLQSLITGLLVFLLSYKLALRLGQKKAAVLTLMLLSLSPVVAMYYSSAVPKALSVLMLLLGFLFLHGGFVDKKKSQLLLASLGFSLAFVVRENYLFTLILYIGFLVVNFHKDLSILIKNSLMILVVLAVFILPGYPEIFNVLKNFPGISSLLPVSHQEQAVLSLNWQQDLHNTGLYIRAVVEFIIIYHVWFLAIFAAGLITWKSHQKLLDIGGKGNRKKFWIFIISVAGLNFLAHSWAMFQLSPRAIISYFSTIAPLAAVILATIITSNPKVFKIDKSVVPIYLLLLLLIPLSLYFASIFTLPTKQTDLKQISQSTERLEPILQDKEKIVWLSEPISLYYTGRTSYYPLINHINFYKPSQDTPTVRRLGSWNLEMLDEWFEEADLVVIGENKLKLLNNSPQVKNVVTFINTELDKNYHIIDTRDDIWPGQLRFYEPNSE